MRKKFVTTGTLIVLIGLSSNAQTGTPGQNRATVPGTNLPPGLQGREQLPPGLSGRQQLPPGLSNQFGAITNQPGIGIGSNQFGLGTNQLGLGSNQFGFGSNRFGLNTNQFWATTNRWGTTNLTPTSDSNRPGRGYQDNRLPSGLQNPQSGPPPRVNSTP
jgi:hypothetical protein